MHSLETIVAMNKGAKSEPVDEVTSAQIDLWLARKYFDGMVCKTGEHDNVWSIEVNGRTLRSLDRKFLFNVMFLPVWEEV